MYFKFIILIILILNKLKAQDDLIRQTSNGLIRGRSSSNVNLWLGVPFAEPPVDHLRFKRPFSKSNWTGILNTNTVSSICMQSSGGSEDCLKLNIILPKNISLSMPVVIWIHGGGFTGGSAGSSYYSNFAVYNKVIVVAIQYRLGIFGFMSLNSIDAPGNMGLLDQSMAIKWVYDNIKYFGGDNTRITIGGQSAGGKST